MKDEMMNDRYVMDRNPRNLLRDFWQRESDACPLEATTAEKQEIEFDNWVDGFSSQLLDAEEPRSQAKERREALKKAAEPLLKYLCENHHPHVTCIVTGTSIKLLKGICSAPKIYDFVKD